MSDTAPQHPTGPTPATPPSPEDLGHPVLTRPGLRQVLRGLVGLALAVALVAWVLPTIGDTTWSQILEQLGGVGAGTALWLFALLFTGLCSYSLLLTGSLPGLRNRQGLVVNLGGSAVSNVLPAGGLMGVAVTYLMCRSWGFARRDISTSVVVTAVWNLLARMALPVLGVAALLTDAGDLPGSVVSGSLVGVVVGLGLLGAFSSVLVSDRAAATIGRLMARFLGPLARRRGRSGGDVERMVLDLRARLSSVVRTGALRMTAGLSGWFLFSFLLFWQCLHTMGVTLPPGHLFAGYAVGRLLTAIPITPGAVGVTEAGALAVLVALGAQSAEATAGVVLFSIYSVLMVVPLGAIAWLAWAVSSRTRRA